MDDKIFDIIKAKVIEEKEKADKYEGMDEEIVLELKADIISSIEACEQRRVDMLAVSPYCPKDFKCIGNKALELCFSEVEDECELCWEMALKKCCRNLEEVKCII